MGILKLIHHQKVPTFQLKMFATYRNTIQNCVIKDRTVCIRLPFFGVHAYMRCCCCCAANREQEKTHEQKQNQQYK